MDIMALRLPHQCPPKAKSWIRPCMNVPYSKIAKCPVRLADDVWLVGWSLVDWTHG